MYYNCITGGVIDTRYLPAIMKGLMEKAGVIPEELNQFMRGFMESRLFLTAVEIDLFTAVNQGARVDDVAKAIGTDPRATEALLNALVAIDLLEKQKHIK